METSKEVLSLSEKLQEDCHRAVEVMMYDNKNVSYQDATNVWLFYKLAELQMKIESKLTTDL